MFWKNLSPDGGDKPEGELAAAIDEHFGDFDGFKTQLTEAALNVQGSGWGALIWEPLGQRLIVEQVYDHQSNVGQGAPPLLVLDMWEHAYYLQYENVKADWVDAFWKIVNWPDVASRFERPASSSSSSASSAQPPLTGGSTATSSPSAERGRVAVDRLVAVEPDAGAVEDLAEPVAVAGARPVEQLAEGRRREVVRAAPGGLAGRREQQQADAQFGTSAGPAGPLGPPTVDAGELVLEDGQLGLERLERDPVAVRARIGFGADLGCGRGRRRGDGLGRGERRCGGRGESLDLHAARLGGRAGSARGQPEFEETGLVGELVLEPGQPGQRVVELEEGLGVERPERREGGGLVGGAGQVVGGELDLESGYGLAELRSQPENAAEQASDDVAPRRATGRSVITCLRVVEQLDLGLRVRIVGQPIAHAQSLDADGREHVPPVGQLPGAHDTRRPSRCRSGCRRRRPRCRAR